MYGYSGNSRGQRHGGLGKVIKEKFPVLESYDMTLEASVTKMMWVLGQTQDIEECRKLFYKTINHDMLFV